MAEFKETRRQTGIQKHWPKEKQEDDDDFLGTNLLWI
jgi:hypothetical protein